MSFSSIVMDHFQAPRGVGTLEEPDLQGFAGSLVSGRFFLLHLRLDEGRIAEARFRTFGCVAAIATGSVLCDWLEKRSLKSAESLAPETLNDLLGGLPTSRQYCIQLAMAALQQALAKAPHRSERGNLKTR